MGIEFERIENGECVLCGRRGSPTGEHKIKASLLREEFGARKTFISGNEAPKICQSSKSKNYQFKTATVCKKCNSTSTQASDRAFDYLHFELMQIRELDQELTDSNNRPIIQISEEIERDSFRYFAKLLCCWIAESGGPRAQSIAGFALGETWRNPIYLNIRKDKDYDAHRANFSLQGLARHGGLVLKFDSQLKWVRAIESSLSIGGVSYIFGARLEPASILEFHMACSDFVETAMQSILDG